MDEITIDDRIYKFAYTMAFRDATMRNAFPRIDAEKEKGDEKDKKKKADDLYHIRKQEVKDHSEPIVRRYIDRLYNVGKDAVSDFDSDNDPSTDTLETIKAICDEYNTERRFTFGNAQKLVNMTAKYMFFSTFSDGDKRRLFAACHCPLDGVILRNLQDEIQQRGLTDVPDIYFGSDFSWSKMLWDGKKIPDEYERFQNCVKIIADKRVDETLPLEVDFLYWDK